MVTIDKDLKNVFFKIRIAQILHIFECSKDWSDSAEWDWKGFENWSVKQIVLKMQNQ